MKNFGSLVQSHVETYLANRITDQNRFLIRLTNISRGNDLTMETLMSHYARHYRPNETGNGLEDLLLNVVFVRNSISKKIVKMYGISSLPWLPP